MKLPMLWIALAVMLCSAPQARAHSITYLVEQKGMTVRAFYSATSAASFSKYELYGPGDKEPHQSGSTDRNGYVAFVPDRPGVWKLKIWGESTHGFHGFTTEITVDQALDLRGFSKPPVAASTKYVTGISLIFGIFGVYALIASRRQKTPARPTP